VKRVLLSLLLLASLGLAGKPLGRWLLPFPYRETIERAARDVAVDPRLVVAVMRIESGFDPGARSRAGARGLMQIMPSTAVWIARRMGLRRFRMEELERPEVNILLGSWYLAHLGRRFDGRLPLVLAAYNAGHASVERWQRAPNPEIEMYPETRDYVVRGMWVYRGYRFLYPREAD
jgi:soluble lytic murein transglycosylase